MYCSNNIQMVDLITNGLEVIEKDNGYNIEIDVQRYRLILPILHPKNQSVIG